MINEFINKIIAGDALATLKQIPSDTIDLVATDPPYGLNFMNSKSFDDRALPPLEVWRECLRVLKPGAFMFVMSAPRSDLLYRMMQRVEDAGFSVAFTPIFWAFASGMPKAMNVSKAVDKKLGAKREIIGYAGDGANRKTSPYNTDHGYNSNNLTPPGNLPVTAPATPQAKALDGSYAGFQPKPAVEVVIVAMKPLSEKNYVNQALTNNKGVTWLDDGRIPFASKQDIENAKTVHGVSGQQGEIYGKWRDEPQPSEVNTKGRFAANLLVSDDALNDGIMRKTGDITPYERKNTQYAQTDSGLPSQYTGTHTGDIGSFSRYFDLDAWAQAHLSQFVITPKASKSEKNKGVEANKHPTVKPKKLFAYLISIGSRENDIVLDPYVGSGSSIIAAKHLQRRFIGIDINSEFVDMANKREWRKLSLNKWQALRGLY